MEFYEVQSTMAAVGENWGLGFPKDGGTPVGNATPEQLRQYDAYYVGNQTENTIYLTFDCGYENGNNSIFGGNNTFLGWYENGEELKKEISEPSAAI